MSTTTGKLISIPTISASGQPSQMGTYEIVQTLGEGAFGEVLLIMDKSNPSCVVAMKKMVIDKDDKESLNIVKKEALLQRHLSKTGHENVIRLIGVRLNHPDFMLFLEYADGGELFDKIEPDVGMPTSRAQHYFRQLMQGLTYIHSFGIAHRDIKPENLLLTSSHILKISDFGMATMFRHGDIERELDMSCGTLPYAAPEIMAGLKYRGEAVDLWSSGVVLITMLTGELPWEKANDSSSSYMNWITNTNLDEAPWNKIDVMGLSLLRQVVTNNVTNRATIKKICAHPWYSHNYGSFKDPIRRKTLSDIKNLPCTQYETVSPPKRMRTDDDSIEKSLGERSAFSQPTRTDEMLLTQHIDLTQGSTDPMRRLVCRMTRFCVNIDIDAAFGRVVQDCEDIGFAVRRKAAHQALVSLHGTALMVNAYNMKHDNESNVMIDFRRSRGDGIQFKRMFLEIRARMKMIICRAGNDWLEHHGLTPPSQDIEMDETAEGI